MADQVFFNIDSDIYLFHWEEARQKFGIYGLSLPLLQYGMISQLILYYGPGLFVFHLYQKCLPKDGLINRQNFGKHIGSKLINLIL